MSLCSNGNPKNSGSLVLSVFILGTIYRFVLHDFHDERAATQLSGTQFLDTVTNDFQDREGECMETKLFKMWQGEAEAEKLILLGFDNHSSFVENHTLTNAGHVELIEEARKDAQVGAVIESTSFSSSPRGLRGRRSMTALEGLAAEEGKRAQDAKARRAKFDLLYEETKKAIHQKSSSPPEWLHIQAQLQRQYDDLPSTRARLARERRQEFDKLFDETQALLNSKKDTVTPWAQKLMSSQAELQSRLEHLHHDHKVSYEFEGTRANLTGKAKLGAKASLDKLFAETEAMLHAKENVTSPWAQHLMETQAEMQSRLEHLHDGHQQRSKLRGSRVVVERNATVVAAPRSSMQLNWFPVKSWLEGAPRRDSGPNNTDALTALTMTREQLRRAKWDGKVPNVSCVMALPTNASAQYHFKYAINNFKLQHYDGDSELIVVYHHGDEVAARLVRTYSEEGKIRGVASRAKTEFPSTMALRYGAWTSKSDVIAEWDFYAWHHPDRLSTQVRAMAMSGRPASLVLNNESPAGTHVNVMRGSLIGDSAWMREHWHPLLDEEHGNLEIFQSHNMVLVDAPALTIDHHHTLAMNGSLSPASPMVGHDALESLGIEICRSILVEGLGENKLVDGMADRISNAMRNVSNKLQALCKEADEKVDHKERSFMHHHAGTMETMRRQLGKYLLEV